MDIYLKELGNINSQLRFPSMPQEDIDIKNQTMYQEYNILQNGRYSFPVGMEKRPIKWSGFFWGKSRKNMSSINREWISPDICISKLSTWQENRTPLNLIVSGAGINVDVTIQEFNYKPFGGSGDFSYEISFLRYQELQIYTTKELGVEKKAAKKTKTNRTSTAKNANSKKKKTYKVVQGDTLCKISRKKYKTESKWKTIYNANKNVIEKAAKKHGRNNSDNGHWIYPGTILTIP